MGGYMETTVELIVGFFALLIFTKFTGRSSISEATPFDFVAALVLGEFVGGAIYDPKVDIWKILYVIALWGVLIGGIDFLTLKVNRMRGLFESSPAILINDGVIVRSEMKRNKIDMNRLQTLLRDKDVFSIREVAFALLEPNGKISVIKKPIFETVRRIDLDLPTTSVSLPVTLVSDGMIIKDNFVLIGRDVAWLKSELKKRGIENLRDVMLAEWREEDGLYVQTIYNGP
ncbi:DUF421 domain-containing protein [Caenibacillus caldisaponilyticus]|jgi:uncharacterized membrane protein YcaP (DUF421 family)|uniref:DUF421 domain-containing protein n=1 Tax=Caenibacillus caldisaponilyticus TaxID=1674942 RepID=UPI00098860F1|nr:DUF421 domain-containing protein [Caenibacillus caldisaponilyticus]